MVLYISKKNISKKNGMIYIRNGFLYQMVLYIRNNPPCRQTPPPSPRFSPNPSPCKCLSSPLPILAILPTP